MHDRLSRPTIAPNSNSTTLPPALCLTGLLHRFRVPQVVVALAMASVLALSCAGTALGSLSAQSQDAGKSAEKSADKTPGKFAIAVPAANVLPAIKARVEQGHQAAELAQILEGFDSKLTNALVNSRKFDVRIHSDVARIIREQQSQDSGNYDLADPSRARAFKLAGIPYLALVDITDFQDQVETANFESLGTKATRRQIRLTISCRIVDTTKGTILESVNLTASDMDFKNNAAYVVDQKGGDLTQEVVNVIADRMANDVANRVIDSIYPAKVVAFNDGRAAINRGEGTGIAAGQVWQVFAVGDSITDPDTGEVLGSDEAPVGFVRIVQVEARLARAEVCGENRGIAKDCIVRRSDRKDCGDPRPATSGNSLDRPAKMIASAPEPSSEAAASAPPAESAEPKRTAAIFIRNRERKIDDSRVMVLEDFLVAGLDDTCFTTISREDCLLAVAKFAAKGSNAGTPIDPEKDLDKLLSNQASALSLAQSMGADYLLVASITALTTERREQNDAARGISTDVTSFTLDATYRILGRAEGRVLATGSAMATDSVRSGNGVKVERDVVPGLLRDCAGKLAAAMRKRCEKTPLPAADTLAEATIEITGLPSSMAVPDIVKDDKGNWVVAPDGYKLQATNFSIEIDGVVVGTTPSAVRTTPGIHKLRVTRADFDPYEQTVNIAKGAAPLAIAVRPSATGLVRWAEMTAFFHGLKQGQQLTEAQVKVLNGYADFLKNSKVSIESKSDVKVDTKEAPVFTEKSVWHGVVVQEK